MEFLRLIKTKREEDEGKAQSSRNSLRKKSFRDSSSRNWLRFRDDGEVLWGWTMGCSGFDWRISWMINLKQFFCSDGNRFWGCTRARMWVFWSGTTFHGNCWTEFDFTFSKNLIFKLFPENRLSKSWEKIGFKFLQNLFLYFSQNWIKNSWLSIFSENRCLNSWKIYSPENSLLFSVHLLSNSFSIRQHSTEKYKLHWNLFESTSPSVGGSFWDVFHNFQWFLTFDVFQFRQFLNFQLNTLSAPHFYTARVSYK